MRKVRPSGASFAATCVGLKKNTRFFWNAVSTRAVAMPSATTPSAIAAMRLCLGFMPSFYLPGGPGAPRTAEKKPHLQRQDRERHGVGRPDEEAMAHSRSRIMQRTRTSTAAIEYAQKASAISSIPVSMVAAMLGARVRLTEAPWCSVFHHCTE